MGRLALRAALGNPLIQIVHINELQGGPETAAHLLEFDSVHGRSRAAITRLRTDSKSPATISGTVIAQCLAK
jgi:glyceraldehyde-3-phosphate dehydrogenase/erythrose-4-phosphate dehydrogenase